MTARKRKRSSFKRLRQIKDKLPHLEFVRQMKDELPQSAFARLREAFEEPDDESDLTPSSQMEPLALQIEPLPPQPRRTRREGAGHPPSLTDDQITRGREIFRNLLRNNPRLRRATRAEQVRQVKNRLRLGREVSDDTFLRRIIRPVLSPPAQ